MGLGALYGGGCLAGLLVGRSVEAMGRIRLCVLVLASALLASACGGGSDSAELEALRETVRPSPRFLRYWKDARETEGTRVIGRHGSHDKIQP